jgi:hypothetical protein
MENLNKVFVIGTLVEVNTRKDEKDGKNYIGGSFVVESEGNLIEFKLFSYQLTKEGKPNKKYTNYENLQNLIGSRVRVPGEISGRALYNESKAQVIPFAELNAGFVNLAKDTEQDTRTFEFSGFVTETLHERENQEGDLLYYEMSIGQANYSGENLNVVKFRVDKDSAKMVSVISDIYVANSTVSINGLISYVPHTETVKTEVAFGEAIVKTFNSVRKSFIITGGKEPISGETAYTDQQIEKLQEAYQNYLLDVEKKSKEETLSGKTVVTPKPAQTNKIGGLL